MTTAMADRHDFTRGPLALPLARFCLPILGVQLLQSANGTVSAIWVGRGLGPTALAAVTNANLLLFILTGAIFGVVGAAGIVVGQALGRGDEPLARRTATGGAVLFLGLSVVAALLCAVVSPALLAAIGVPIPSRGPALAYLYVNLAATPATYAFIYLIGMTRAAGGASAPFWFQTGAVLADIALTPLLVFGLGPVPGLGTAGAALASALSQGSALAALLVLLVRRGHPLLPRRGEQILPDRALAALLIRKGLPMGLQTLVVSTAALALLTFVNRFGASTVAAYGAAAQLWNFVQMPALAVAIGLGVIAAQNVGAGNFARVRRALGIAVLIQLGTTGTLLGLSLLARHAVLGLFTVQPVTLAEAVHIHVTAGWSFLLLGTGYILFAPLRASGKVLAPLAVSIIALWLVRMPLIAALLPRFGADAIWWGIAAAAALSVPLALACFPLFRWTHRAVLTPTNNTREETTMSDANQTIDRMLDDPRHGWSIGTFGAIGEFIRDADEPVKRGPRTLVTARGGIRVAPDAELTAIAYDTLSSDGETWGQSVAFCLPRPANMAQAGVRALGPDAEALREEDRTSELFDLGVGLGHVAMHLRTADAELIAALKSIEGRPLFGPDGGAVMAHVLRAQPHRVLTSPAGRVEVYQPIPLPGGDSPVGPHTHLLPKMLASKRTHAANAPIPEGLQPVLLLHPRSPWRDEMGRRVPFDATLDQLFAELLDRHGLADDKAVSERVAEAIGEGADPKAFVWPDSRRGRTKARITLRRLAHEQGEQVVAGWRAMFDRAPVDSDEEALHQA